MFIFIEVVLKFERRRSRHDSRRILSPCLYFQDIYEPISEEHENRYSFIKIFNAGEKYVIHKHEGYLQSKVGWLIDWLIYIGLFYLVYISC